MAVAITCGYGGYLLPLLAAHSSFILVFSTVLCDNSTHVLCKSKSLFLCVYSMSSLMSQTSVWIYDLPVCIFHISIINESIHARHKSCLNTCLAILIYMDTPMLKSFMALPYVSIKTWPTRSLVCCGWI